MNNVIRVTVTTILLCQLYEKEALWKDNIKLFFKIFFSQLSTKIIATKLILGLFHITF